MGDPDLVEVALTALNKALVERNPGPGLVHHSDRGLQYASSEDLGHMRVNIEEFIDRYYNRQRLHSALGDNLLLSSCRLLPPEPWS
jgi:transposase InsO family protein